MAGSGDDVSGFQSHDTRFGTFFHGRSLRLDAVIRLGSRRLIWGLIAAVVVNGRALSALRIGRIVQDIWVHWAQVEGVSGASFGS
jgi:hypothetical protein